MLRYPVPSNRHQPFRSSGSHRGRFARWGWRVSRTRKSARIPYGGPAIRWTVAQQCCKGLGHPHAEWHRPTARCQTKSMVEFVVQGCRKHLAHRKWQWRDRSVALAVSAGIVQILVIHLIFADVEEELPARIVAFRVGVEPSRKWQAQVDETAKRPDGPLRSNHDLPSRVRSQKSVTSDSDGPPSGVKNGPTTLVSPFTSVP